ncbi:alpha/beta hydrolase [uncultured Maritalea sp.]|uniref:alpha/beta hydrolase n=1 Tax=uncultured Maritalea sp. TaxID=757249 RepID=UPI0026310AC1|nr:alpha/beta hydrolase [uncultured Maritalea sp.]
MQILSQHLTLGEANTRRQLAILHRKGNGPGLFWLGGYNSDMQGSKAVALDQFGAQNDLPVTRFDYMAHGQSTGDFMHATISTWLEDAIAVFENFTDGPQILVGSSMGGWLSMLLNQHLRARNINSVTAMVLIAPAIDMTRELVPNRFTQKQLQELKRVGYLEVPSAYADAPYIYTQKLLDDGAQHLLFGTQIETGCPVHILQGQQDPDVPPAHAQRLLQHLMLDEAHLTLVPDGDHRLSRPQDLEMLRRLLSSLVQE